MSWSQGQNIFIQFTLPLAPSTMLIHLISRCSVSCWLYSTSGCSERSATAGRTWLSAPSWPSALPSPLPSVQIFADRPPNRRHKPDASVDTILQFYYQDLMGSWGSLWYLLIIQDVFIAALDHRLCYYHCSIRQLRLTASIWTPTLKCKKRTSYLDVPNLILKFIYLNYNSLFLINDLGISHLSLFLSFLII